MDEAADDPQVDEQAFEQPETYDYDPEAATPGSAESWSASELPESKREQLMKDVPRALRQQVRKTHVGLGHPTKEVFLRMLRLGGASPVAQELCTCLAVPSLRTGRCPSTTSCRINQVAPAGVQRYGGHRLEILQGIYRVTAT